jgi:hypothetical protein
MVMKKDSHRSYFVPGEEELKAMITQLTNMGSRADKSVDKGQIYRANGVIRLAAVENLEIVVLKTAGPFGIENNSKITFDNSKGMFALLAMLRTIADMYKHALAKNFRKLNVYFVQISGKNL